MFCSNCGNKLLEGAKFCGGCGKVVPLQERDGQKNEFGQGEKNIEEDRTITNDHDPKGIIKCGNCGFIGQGDPARRMIFKILAWSVVLFAPLLTLLYFLATHKYRCPKCHSTFVGVKNKHGIFVEPRSAGSRWAIIIIIIFFGIAIIGILASIVLASLNSARIKSRDARRISDIKQIQLALELYYNDYLEYPTSLSQLKPKYKQDGLTDPSNQASYNYTNCVDGSNYHLGASLEEEKNLYLSTDEDVNSLCTFDPISGSDESKCSDIDFGSYCYDVTSIE